MSTSEVVDPGYVAKTLAWCNEKREEQGQPALDRLPKGERHDPNSCPCGRATGLHVDTTWYTRGDDPTKHELPSPVRDFVGYFDEGELPQYDENPDDPEDDDEEFFA